MAEETVDAIEENSQNNGENNTIESTEDKGISIAGIDQNTLNTTAAELVMKLAEEMVDKFIMPYQLIINYYPLQFGVYFSSYVRSMSIPDVRK